MRAALLDTNIIIGASGLSGSMTAECCLNCVQRVKQWRGGALMLVVDVEGVIQNEYLRQFKKARTQPGFQGSLAQQLIEQLLTLNGMDDAAARKANVLRVTLTVIRENEYAEFPGDDRALANFDPADRKWIAAALSCSALHGETPEIQNAADSDWNAVADHLLEKYHIAVSNICG